MFLIILGGSYTSGWIEDKRFRRIAFNNACSCVWISYNCSLQLRLRPKQFILQLNICNIDLALPTLFLDVLPIPDILRRGKKHNASNSWTQVNDRCRVHECLSEHSEREYVCILLVGMTEPLSRIVISKQSTISYFVYIR